MPSLAEIQSAFRDALVFGTTGSVQGLLTGGPDPGRGLGIHQRNYAASLVAALTTKFPATIWLAGTSFVTNGATLFVGEHPPQAPCIAEYGDNFPGFLAALRGADRMPYLKEFAELEWHVGRVSVEVVESHLTLGDMSEIDANRVAEVTLCLQPGLRYRKTSWPVDDLLALYLTDTAPDRYVLSPCDAYLEIRGGRGEFHIDRLSPPDFIFSERVSQGLSLGAAAEIALDADASFDTGRGLLRLIANGLVTRIQDDGGSS